MLKTTRDRTAPEMPLRSHFEDQRRKNWCAVVVLVALFALTLSVATRYSSPCTASLSSVKTVQSHTCPDAKRQRLVKDAADWMPPVTRVDGLSAPNFYPRMSPAGPPIPTLLLEDNLHNRPPPSFRSFS